jgi:hypothetical protein
MKHIIILITFLFFISPLHSNEADDILNKIVEKHDNINQYQAEINIKIDVDFINIEERKATVTYKKPDIFNVEIENDGFALLPKNGAQMEYLSILKQPHTALIDRDEKLDGKQLKVIKIIPSNSKDNNIILAEFWIDVTKSRVYRLKAFTSNEGNYTADFEYASHPFDLPDKLILKFDIKNMNIPNYMSGEMKNNAKENGEKTTEGKVIIKYLKYNIN